LVTGAMWLGLIVAAATTRFGAEQYAALLARPEGTVVQIAQAIGFTMICPFLLIGDHVPARSAVSVALAGASALSLAAGIGYVRWRDYPLEGWS
jgi:hypothetical protein